MYVCCWHFYDRSEWKSLSTLITRILVNVNSRYFYKHNICALSLCVCVLASSQTKCFWHFVRLTYSFHPQFPSKHSFHSSASCFFFISLFCFSIFCLWVPLLPIVTAPYVSMATSVEHWPDKLAVFPRHCRCQQTTEDKKERLKVKCTDRGFVFSCGRWGRINVAYKIRGNMKMHYVSK